MKYLPAILLFVLCMPLWANAQQTHTTTTHTTTRTATAGKITAEIIATSSTAVVKGSPFSAEAISESIQTLSDGNKITRSNTTRMFRDSEGRFRRETSPSEVNTTVNNPKIAQALGFQGTISIFDPVSSQRYMLNPTDKTAQRLPVLSSLVEGAVIANGQSLSHAVKTRIEADISKQNHIVVLPSVGGATTIVSNGKAGKTEPLGMRSFDGVEAEGTRTVTTIPAGSIGNERDIDIVYERWYSKDLQLIVYSKHTDPRFGEQIYRLENINRNEPDHSLFTLPADYKVVSEPKFNVVRTKPMQ